MPGIAAIVSKRPSVECQQHVAEMLAAMLHEPWYASGTCFIPEQGIYAGWTAPADADAAASLVGEKEHAVSVISTGECVAADEIRSTSRRCNGNGASMIAAAYIDSGVSFVNQLNGLFAGLLVDRQLRRAFLFNDRYSLERIYYYETKEATYFASEAKALLRVLPELRAFDDQGVAEYLAVGCTTGTRTLFRGVRLLEGGSLWTFNAAGVHKQRYFSPAVWEGLKPLTTTAFETEFQATFKRILPRYFRAPSRMGISLTGGLDTRMIMACLPVTTCPPVCYTFSAETHSTADELVAARVAAACGLEHHVFRIGKDFLSDYVKWVDRTIYATDGCSGATGAHETYFNVLARELSPFRITGNFGSEILRDVSTFKPIDLSTELLDKTFASSVAQCGIPRTSAEHSVTFAAFREIPWRLFGTLSAARSQITFRTPYLDDEIVALAFRAPAQCRSTDTALRVVKCNNKLLSAIPTDMGIRADRRLDSRIRQALSQISFKLDYLSQEGVPQRASFLAGMVDRLARKAARHRYLPYRQWFRYQLSNHVTALLTDGSTLRFPYWNHRALEGIAQDHISGNRNYVREINAVLTLDAVDRLIVRQ